MRSNHPQGPLAGRGSSVPSPVRRVALAGAFVAVLALGPLSGSAFATTYNVTRFDDPDNGQGACATGGSCSLREALNTVNATPSPPDLINLPAGTYTNDRAAGFPIGNSVSIMGAGSATTTIKGSLTSEVLTVTAAGDTKPTFVISGVTMTGGHAATYAGAINPRAGVYPALILDHVAIVGNTGPYEGGVLQSGGSMTITNSLIANNAATAGGSGGLSVQGGSGPGGTFARITNTTVTGNSATGNGAFGGGISVTSASLTLANSTVAGNSVSGTQSLGGNLGVGALSPVTSTVAIENSVIAAGHGGKAGNENCAFFAYTEMSGYNVEDRNQCGLTGPGDQVNTDPMLGTLAVSPDASSTLPLLPGSPAINNGDPTGCKDAFGVPLASDQRGVTRPQGARCDSGAFEFQVPVLTGTTTVSGTPNVGQTLTCNPSTGSSPDGGTVSSTYAWLRDGAVITGVTSVTYTAVVADSGHKLSCQFTATNVAGSASVTSAGVAVTQPGGGGGGGGGTTTAAKIVVISTTVTVDAKTGNGTLAAECVAPAGQTCDFKGALYGTGKLPADVASGTHAKLALILGKVSGTIAAGKTGKLTVHLRKAALKTLNRNHHLGARLYGKVTATGKSTTFHSPLTIKLKTKHK